MRLAYKFALLLSFCVIGAVGVTTYFQAALFAEEQTSSLKDLQSSFAVMSARRLTERMNILMAQLEPFATPARFGQIIGKLPGSNRGEIRPNTRGVASVGSWGLEKGSSAESILWRGWFPQQEIALELDRSWFNGILESSHGAIVRIFDANGNVLLSPTGDTEDAAPASRQFREIASPDSQVAQTRRYTNGAGTDYLGTFLSLPTEPRLVLNVSTPWQSVEAVIERTYGKARWIAFLLLIAAVTIGTLFAATLTRPLRLLSEEAGRIATGDFAISTLGTTRRRDEVGMLSRTFSDMAGQLEKLRADLRQSERLAALGQFSAAVAHEIKNPLSSILGNAQILKRELSATDGDRETILTSLGFVESETLRASRTISQLMKFARRDQRPEHAIDVAEVFRNAARSLLPVLEREGITLVDDISATPQQIHAHGDQLQEVFSNLLQNAIHAMKSSATKRLRVATDTADGMLSLIVEDTGSGISPEAKAHLFEPFFTTKPFGEGTGLGLSVCHGVVTNHGGTIAVASLDPGTRFTLRFPKVPLSQRAL